MKARPVQIVFLVLPNSNLFDFAAAAQVFYEAKQHGCDVEISYCCYTDSISSASGLPIGKIRSYKEMHLSKNDYLFIGSSETQHTFSNDFNPGNNVLEWLNQLHDKGVTLCGLCLGTFLLGMGGLLNERNCTTHWKKTTDLRRFFPKAKVQENVLFIEDGNIITSAGATSGIDVALYILQKLKDDFFSYTISRELVIYNRKNGNDAEYAPYLNYRNHVHSGIHRVQDWIQQNLNKRPNLQQLAEIALMSERNFTRIFKRETGHTVNEFVNCIRKEKIKQLLKNPNTSRAQIAKECGLKSERHLQRLMHTN